MRLQEPTAKRRFLGEYMHSLYEFVLHYILGAVGYVVLVACVLGTFKLWFGLMSLVTRVRTKAASHGN